MFVSYHCYVAFCVSYARSSRSTEEKLLSKVNLLTTYEDEKVLEKPTTTVVAKPSWLFLLCLIPHILCNEAYKIDDRVVTFA